MRLELGPVGKLLASDADHDHTRNMGWLSSRMAFRCIQPRLCRSLAMIDRYREGLVLWLVFPPSSPGLLARIAGRPWIRLG